MRIATGDIRSVQHRDALLQDGRYVLGGLLGRGGMAEVFAGSSIGSHGFQKPVAIKRLLPQLASDRVFVDRLIGEAKLLVGMQHGNIVSVLDLAREGDDVFLVMEFVDGPSLSQLLKAHRDLRLSLAIATHIVQHAAAGLDFAHARPGGAVIHADVSPSNLLLSTSGEVRVADFGIARREGGEAHVVEGKWAYMAPEQARGEPLTPASDVFALGVVLYELVVGQNPFGRHVSLAMRASPIASPRPRDIDPAIPPGLDAICMRALAHDPCDRYASMRQLIDALVEERYINGWRAGASELARVIRDITLGSALGRNTLVTDRPVTIFTSSLIAASPGTPALADGTPLPAGTPDYAAMPLAQWQAPAQWPPPAAAMLPPAAPLSEHAPVVAHSKKWLVAGVLGVSMVAGAAAAIVIGQGPEDGPIAPAPSPAAPAASVPTPSPSVAAPTVDAAAEPAAPPAPPDAKTVDPPDVSHSRPAGKSATPHNPRAAEAFLRVDTFEGEWARITIGSEFHDSPGARFHLAPGHYTLRVSNDDVHFTCPVDLEADRVSSVVVSLTDAECH